MAKICMRNFFFRHKTSKNDYVFRAEKRGRNFENLIVEIQGETKISLKSKFVLKT
jgi:hypothetical protein